MSYTAAVHAQDHSVGRVEEVLHGIEQAAKAAGAYAALDAAVAYASGRGARLLVDRLQSTSGWASSAKRFLISIDFGITDPSALTFLASLPGAEVRIPNASAVLANVRLMPPRTFHAKGYLFRGRTWGSPSGLVIGSANMTVSALATGSEAVSTHSWNGTLGRQDSIHLSKCQPFLDWFHDAWARAEPAGPVIPLYDARYRSRPSPRGPREDRTRAARAYAADPNRNVVAGRLGAQLLAADAVWFQTDVLYANRGPGKAGNQLDTPRGTRVFFGFPATNNPKNRVFGHVMVQVGSKPAVSRSVRFAGNSMDKVNLPVPGREGPSTYDNSVLIFERTGQVIGGLPLFRLVVTDTAGLQRRKGRARHAVDLEMGTARHRGYGLLF